MILFFRPLWIIILILIWVVKVLLLALNLVVSRLVACSYFLSEEEEHFFAIFGAENKDLFFASLSLSFLHCSSLESRFFAPLP